MKPKAATRAIRIDEEVYDSIKRLAKPLVDTPNSVLRRLFKLDKPQEGKK